MRKTVSMRWHLSLAIFAIGSFSGCASSPEPRDPNQVVLPVPADAGASAPAVSAVAVVESQRPDLPVPLVGAKASSAVWSLEERDKTLKVALERWAQATGWRLLWELGVDYRIGAQARLHGSFEEAVTAVMHNLHQAEVPPKAIFYRGNQVVRIVARGME